MTSTIKVNNIQNQCGANIINENSNTITIGASGDTIALASGASQTGFGRTGAVNWQTTKKTATFTATSGEGYFCDTSGGAFTLNLPSSPSAGDIVGIKDYGGDFSSNNLTIGRGGSPLDGTAANKALDTRFLSLTLVYVDGTQGWIPIEEGTGFIGEAFIDASVTGSGNAITTAPCGNYKLATFTGPGNFTVSSLASCSANNAVEYLVVAGGGGGGCVGGGGGAGGFRFATPTLNPATFPGKPLNAPSGLTLSAQTYPITVGGGGAKGANDCSVASSGSPAVFSTITSAGGGGGTGRNGPAAGSGGSGGGAASESTGGPTSGGSGNTPPVSPPQGNNGGASPFPTGKFYGGGGGATAAGAAGGSPPAGAGGNGGDGAGVPTGFGSSGVPCGGFQFFAGGAGGGNNNPPCGPTGVGGKGGGGNGQINNCVTNPPNAGTANTGGGGGGGGAAGTNGGAGAGGSGIVIIRYKFQ